MNCCSAPWQKGRRGAAMLELILITPLLMLLLLAIVEFGLLANEVLMVHQACYEAAGEAALGKPVGAVRRRVIELAPRGVQAQDVAIECLPPQESVRNPAPGSGPAPAATQNWTAVGDVPGVGQNDAPTGAIIRVTVKSFPHRLITGSFFSWLPAYRQTDIGPVLLVHVSASQPKT